MSRRIILTGIAALALLTGAAGAQEAGGLAVAGPGLGQMHQARPAQDGAAAAGPLARAPADVKAANPARARDNIAQQAIASIRGDAGYLAGFHFGQPLAASRQPPPDFGPPPELTVIEAPFIVNSQDSVVNLAVGDGNSTQQAAASAPAAANPPASPPADKGRAASAANPATPPGLTAAAALAQAFGGSAVNSVDSQVNMAIGSGNTARQRVDLSR